MTTRRNYCFCFPNWEPAVPTSFSNLFKIELNNCVFSSHLSCLVTAFPYFLDSFFIKLRFRSERSSGAASLLMSVKKKRDFDVKAFLSTIGEGRRPLPFREKQRIFAQGDAAAAVFYIQSGKVKLTVVSNNGKEATIGILGEMDFFGESCLAGQPLRTVAAT